MNEHTERQAEELFYKARLPGTKYWRELSEEERYPWYDLSKHVDALISKALRQGEFGQ